MHLRSGFECMGDRHGGGEWGSGGVASRCGWGERRSGPHPVFFFLGPVFTITHNKREKGGGSRPGEAINYL